MINRPHRARARFAHICAALVISGSFVCLVTPARACTTPLCTTSAVCTLLSSCAQHNSQGGPVEPSDTGPTRSRGGGIVQVSIVDFAFQPEDIVIQPNTTVRWINNGFLSQHSSRRQGSWDTGFLNPGQSGDVNFTASNAGRLYDYVCGVHPFTMSGTVTVVRFGDANMDENVNLTDFNTLASHFGQLTGGTWETGDFNADGKINLADFNLLASNFGLPIQNAFSNGFGSIPEPASAAAIVLPMTTAAIGRRRRRS
jgi:plastocyanin